MGRILTTCDNVCNAESELLAIREFHALSARGTLCTNAEPPGVMLSLRPQRSGDDCPDEAVVLYGRSHLPSSRVTVRLSSWNIVVPAASGC